MQQNLSFEQAPPYSVPVRFFLTAPWFGVAAGLTLAWYGESAMSSRWTAEALALTHLLAVGFMLQAMTGAVFQFVPVAAGGNVWRPRVVAGVLHPLLLLAAVVLVAGFMIGTEILFRIAGTVFLLAVGLEVVVIGRAVVRTPAEGATIRALRLATVGLGATVMLGVVLTEGLGGRRSWPLIEITNVHAAWGLGGWALVLLAGVSYFVVPMFQLTPPYPDRFARWLPPALVGILCLWSLQIVAPAWLLHQVIWLVGLALGGLFAGVTLGLLRQRRRRLTDAASILFRVAMICLLAAFCSALIMAAVPAMGDDPRACWWLGILIFPGLFVSVINGMLYRIVPFIGWLHLQQVLGLARTPPNVRDMLSTGAMRGQMWLHLLALGLLMGAVPWPMLAKPAGAVFAASCAWLGWNLLGAVRFFVGFRDRIRADGEDRVP